MSEGERDEAPAATWVSTPVVVFEGSINPAIITVNWLRAQGLVQDHHAADAVVRFSSADLSQFEVAQFRVEARRDRLVVAATKDLETPFPVKDLAQGIFEVLRHTPISALAMSKAVHVTLPHAESWGRLSAAATGRFGSLLLDPTLQTLQFRGRRADLEVDDGEVEISIEGSQHVPGAVYVVVTYRFDYGDQGSSGSGAKLALETLNTRWDDWMPFADKLVDEVLETGAAV